MKFLILSVLLTTTLIVSAQCNCELINREDGTTITQCPPLPVAFNDDTQVGVSASSNGESVYITVTVRFRYTADDFSGDLSIRLNDNNQINLEIVNSGLALVGNSQLAHAIFIADSNDILKLNKSGIKTISFRLKDGLLRTYEVKSNSTILMNQLTCL